MPDKTLFSFLRKLKSNNSKQWMDEHRSEYEKSKIDFTDFTNNLLAALSAFDNSLSTLNAKDCMFRINRDIRFSKNKAPYKTNFAAYFSKGGKKGPEAGYYIHAEPGNCFLAAGIWMPEPGLLSAIRQEIDYNTEEFENILRSGKFKKHFTEGLDKSATLSRPPKGYDDSHPALEYIKLKSYIVRKNLTEKDFTAENAVQELSGIFKTAKPLIDFINRASD